MTKEKILNLPNNQESYDKLKTIIKSSHEDTEVFYAWLKQAEILHAHEEYEKASKILIQLYNDNKFLDDKYLVLLIDSLILTNNKPEALYYINLRKESLSQLEMYKHYLDLLKYKKVFNEDFYPLLDTLRAYSFDKSVLIPYYILKFKDVVLNNSSLVEETYSEVINLNLDNFSKEEVDELYFKHLISNGYSTEEFLKNKKGINKVFYELRLLMKEKELKKVQILEAEYEMELENLSLNNQQILFEKLMDFYEEHHDLKSYDLYSKKYKLVKNKLKKINNEVEKKRLEFGEDEEPVIEEVKITEKEKEKPSVTSEKISQLADFISDLSTLELGLSLFDRLRNIGILIEKYFDLSDILFYVSPQFYHYKKERLYSKNYSLATINSSIVGQAANDLIDIVGEVEFIKPDYDLISDKPLTETNIKQVYSYGVQKGFSITFYQTNKKDLHYDDLVFKTISSIVYYDLKYDKHINIEKQNYNKINALFNSEFLISFIYKNEFFGNRLFNDLFSLKKNNSLDALILKFPPEYRVKYNSLFNRLKKEEIKSFEIDLFYEGKNYLAKHYINKGNIYGVFIDVTEKVAELESWQEKAFIDPLSALLTLHEFEVAFKNYIKEKTSFILIELDNLDKIESIYGKAMKRKFFLEFVEFCKEEFSQVYLFDQNSILAVLNINDVRAVENKVSRFSLKVKDMRSKILKEQHFNCYMGIIRYPINTREKNIDRIYQYLSLTLYKAKTVDRFKAYSYFDFQDYEQDVFETEIIKQIDNLILSEDLLLIYTQIVNQSTKRVYAYEVGVTSKALNIYQEYYYQVAEKRDLLERLEKYILNQAFKNLENIYQETNAYVKLVINVSEKTLNTPNFVGFLIGLYRTYKIPYEVIQIKVNLKSFKYHYSQKLKELSNYGVIIGIDNLDYLTEEYISVFHLTKRQNLEEEKTQSFLKMLNEYLNKQNMPLIVYNVDTHREREILAELKIDYIRGKLVDNELSLEKLKKVLKG